MPFKKAGVEFPAQIENAFGGRTAQNLAGYKINGVDISAAAITSGYLYSSETYTPTGYKKAGAQIVLQKAGCRPRTGTAIWTSGGGGTAYINRFSDGEVWVAAGANSRTGSKISNSIASGVNPRGLRYLILQISGGGGGGGRGGLAVTYSSGGSAAAGAVCIMLPESGYVTITVGGGGGGGNSASNLNGASGTASTISGTGISVNAGAGGGGKGGGSTGNGSAGAWSASGASVVVLASANGSAGSTANTSVSYTDYCPEGGSKSFANGYGGAKGGTGYGSGGTGATGFIAMYY
jgi:hypothetical protein